MKNPRLIAKNTIKILTGYGVSIIVRATYDALMDEDEHPRHQRAAVDVASFAIGGVVANACADYTDDLVDSVADLGVELKKAYQEESKKK